MHDYNNVKVVRTKTHIFSSMNSHLGVRETGTTNYLIRAEPKVNNTWYFTRVIRIK